MEIITRSLTTVHGEPASIWEVRLPGEELVTAGQITRTDAGYVVERTGGRRYTYRNAARAAQAMREHIAEKWPDELTSNANATAPQPDEKSTLADANAVLDLLRGSTELSALVESLTDIQRRTESTGTWTTPLGRAVEYALGHLRLALEAPQLAHPDKTDLRAV
jgi:hypothetical protein